MDRELYTKHFSDERIPKWPCPTCSKGILVADKNTKQSAQGTVSAKRYTEIGEPEILDITISIFLNCSNPECAEKVLGIFQGSPSETEVYDEATETSRPDYETIVEPKYISPPLNFFEMPKNIPSIISECILASFELFFCNPKASLNALRIALEEVLNNLGVKKVSVTKERRVALTLHSRIDAMSSNHLDIQELCFAIKWHGNAGSHSREIVMKNDVLDAYEIFEVILEKAFNDKKKRLEKLAKRMSKQKGVLHPLPRAKKAS